MGIVDCKKHGTSGIVFTCPHLSESTWNFKTITDFVKRVEKDTVDTENNFQIEQVYCLCTNCDEQYKKTSFWEFPECFLQPVCAKCFEELSNLESWK